MARPYVIFGYVKTVRILAQICLKIYDFEQYVFSLVNPKWNLCLGHDYVFILMMCFFVFTIPLLSMASMMIRICKIMFSQECVVNNVDAFDLLLMWLVLIYDSKHEVCLGSQSGYTAWVYLENGIYGVNVECAYDVKSVALYHVCLYSWLFLKHFRVA